MKIGPIKPTTGTTGRKNLRHGRDPEDDAHLDHARSKALVPIENQNSDDGGDDDTPPQEHGYTPLASVTVQTLSGTPARGLRSGPTVRHQAKKAYLNTEYSGPDDRRPNRGKHGERDV